MSETNGFVSRDSLFGAPPARRYAEREFEGFGKFRIRSLMAAEVNSWQAKGAGGKAKDIERAAVTAGPRLIALCLVNANGERILSDLDVAKLLEMDGSFVAELAKWCVEHCRLGDDDEGVEDALKNCEKTAG